MGDGMMTDTSKEAVERHIQRIDPHGYSQPKSLNDDTIRLLRALSAENEALRSSTWKDREDDLTPAIKADFDTDGFYERYARAQDMVSNRHSKGALVSLVAYLLRAQAVTVKPLEWEPTTLNGEHLRDTAAVYGRLMYEAGNHEKGGAYLMTNWRGLSHETFPNWDIAKAAAQADYERRTLSAIDARPASEVAAQARKEALEEAIQIVTPARNAKGGLWAKNLRRKVAKIRALVEKEDG